MPNLSDYNPAVKYGANLDVNVDLTDIRDENNNEQLELDSVASAVNYLRLTNSATGTSIALSAQGDDTNITFQLLGKGSGIATVQKSTPTLNAQGTGTLNSQAGVLTTPLVAITGTTYAVNLTNNRINTTAILIASVANGSNTVGVPSVSQVTPGAGNGTVIIFNGTAVSINGTLQISFLVL